MSSFVHCEKPHDLRSAPAVKATSQREDMISEARGTQGKKEISYN
jgi:hypothetical protein